MDNYGQFLRISLTERSPICPRPPGTLGVSTTNTSRERGIMISNLLYVGNNNGIVGKIGNVGKVGKVSKNW